MSDWTQQDREQAYTALCEAITAAGTGNVQLFLARLTLLLAEELADGRAFANALAKAAFPAGHEAQERRK